MANNEQLVAQCRAKATEWLSPSFDEKHDRKYRLFSTIQTQLI